jgi:hypothetical protein
MMFLYENGEKYPEKRPLRITHVFHKGNRGKKEQNAKSVVPMSYSQHVACHKDVVPQNESGADFYSLLRAA